MDWQLYEIFIQPKLQERSPHNQQDKKGGGVEIWVSPVTLGGCCAKKAFLTLKIPFASWEISQDRQGASVAQRRVQQEEQRETSTDSPGYRVALPSLRWAPAGVGSPECWILGFSRQAPGRGLDLAMQETAWRAWNMEPHLGMCKGWGPDPQQKPHCHPVQKEGSVPPYKPYSQHAKSEHSSATTIFSNCLYTAAGQKSELIPVEVDNFNGFTPTALKA